MHGHRQEERLYGRRRLCGAISRGRAATGMVLTVSSPARPAAHVVEWHSLHGYLTMVLTEKYYRTHPSNRLLINPIFGELWQFFQTSRNKRRSGDGFCLKFASASLSPRGSERTVREPQKIP